MVISHRSSITEGGDSGPSAEEPLNNDRGGNPSIVTKAAKNEETCPNSASGRPVMDVRQLKTRRRMLKIGTWNIRTLYKPGNYHNLKAEMAALKLDNLGIAETRWINDGKISDEDYMTLYSGGNEHQYGVGIMMRKSIASCIIGYWPISDRLIMLKLGGAPFNVNIIQAYAPTSDHPDEKI